MRISAVNLRWGVPRVRMLKKVVYGIILTLLFTSVIMSAFKIPPVNAEPKTIYVDDDNTAGPWDGTPEHPYQNITSGLENSADGDIIFVFNGTYDSFMAISKTDLTLTGESRDGTVVNGTGGTTAYLRNVNNMSISGFMFVLGRILVEYCGSVVIGGNNILNSTLSGIDIIASSDNIIDGNQITGNKECGIWLHRSNTTSIADNKVSSNGIDGICLWISCVNNNVTGNYLCNNNGNGIAVEINSGNNVLEQNNITGNGGVGITISSSSNNILRKNNMTSNLRGIALSKSNSTIVEECKAVNGARDGFFVEKCVNNTIAGNEIADNGEDGVYLVECSCSKLAHNHITGNRDVGINLLQSEYIEITCTGLSNQKYGILMVTSPRTAVTGNWIMNNSLSGIYLAGLSRECSIFHNEFINNTIQAFADQYATANRWDNDYPSGGNYWSDYGGEDPDGDGIGNASYNITASQKDRYPLMSALEGHDVAIVGITLIGHTNISHIVLTPKVVLRNNGGYRENLNVTIFANSTIIGTLYNVSLESGDGSSILVDFNTTMLAEYSRYNITIVITQIEGESNLEDNILVIEQVTIVHMGDVTGDMKVDTGDLARVSGGFGSVRINVPSNQKYAEYWHSICTYCPHTPNADINCDGKVDTSDLARTSSQFGWYKPP